MPGEKTTTKPPHQLPKDFRQAIYSVPKVQKLWEEITPLAKNEWVCWVTSGAKAETRGIRIEKALSKMRGGMRRPCCWIGCTHRTDKQISPSVKWALSKKSGT